MSQKDIYISDEYLCLLEKKQNRQTVLSLVVLNKSEGAYVNAENVTKQNKEINKVVKIDGKFYDEKHQQLVNIAQEVEEKGLKGVVSDYKEKLNPTAFAYFFEYILNPALGRGIKDVDLEQVDAEFRAVQIKKENVYTKE